MDSMFWSKVAIAFLAGGCWVALTTAAAERYGSTIGGLIGGLPSTVLVSLLFIGITQGSDAASAATTLMPVAQGINALFIVCYLFLIPRGAVAGFAGASAAWLVLSAMLAVLGPCPFAVSLCGWALLGIVCCLAVRRWTVIRASGTLGPTCTRRRLVSRAAFGGAVIAAAVAAAKALGPSIGGIFAAFPAMFISTLAVTYRSGGVEISRAVGKSMMMSGLVNVVAYVVAARYLYSSHGVAYGTLFALLVASVTAWFYHAFLRMRWT